MATNTELIKKYKNVNLGEVALPVCFHSSQGAYLLDVEGNSFLDFTSGFGVTSSGWLRKEIANSIQQQLEFSAYAPPWLPTQKSIDLSELLLKITPPNLVYCARATGGADANEIIYKAVFIKTNKRGVLSFLRSYHGGSHFALNLSDTKKFNLPNLPRDSNFHLVEPPYCYRCPYGMEPNSCALECLNPVESLLRKQNDIGSFFVEPLLGSGGVIIPPVKYLRKLRDLCTRYGVFLIFDEVLTGFGRIGAMTASSLFGIRPDAISFAKGISAGYAAIGAAVLSAELADSLKRYEDVSPTFAWTPLSCAIAITNIELIQKEDLPLNAAVQGAYLFQKVSYLFQRYAPEKTGDIRGLGLMIGVELVKDRSEKTPNRKLTQKLIVSCFKRGLMVCASWDLQVVVFMPPLNITRGEIDEGIDRLEQALKDIV